MKSWERDKAASDVYLPEIKRIIGEHLVSEPPIEEDQQRNTDLIVLKLDAVRIACRVRSHSYQDRFGDEFTIRSGRPSGVETELTKVISGWGQYLFYGFGDGNQLTSWTLADLNVFRLTCSRHLAKNRGEMLGTQRDNRDGSSSFRVFRWDAFPAEFVLKQVMATAA